MALSADDVSMALFCDFENIALGVRDAQYEKFDIKPVLERLLLKGSIVIKKAYCDWERYKSFKAAMHEANFELIEIPHVRQSGKNSADIRMVVDALDLCYTKAHVDTFVIISGDSDFSPLVSKLRENAKRVIGVGVKQSTSDLLIANCDEFIYIDDLVRKRQREDKQNRKPADPQEMEARRVKCLDLAVSTLEALLEDRADDEKVWASVLKEAIKRRNPGFNESYFGYRTLGAMLEDAHKRGLLEFGRDERSSAYVKRRAPGAPLPAEAEAEAEAADAVATVPPAPTFVPAAALDRRRRSASTKAGADMGAPTVPPAPTFTEVAASAAPAGETAATAAPEAPAEPNRRRRGGRGRNKPAAETPVAPPQEAAPAPASEQAAAPEPAQAPAPAAAEKPAKKPARPRQPRAAKPAAAAPAEGKPSARKPKKAAGEEA